MAFRSTKFEHLKVARRWRFWKCRCMKCWRRATFKKPPWVWTRAEVPRCCRQPRWFVDWYSQLKRDKTRFAPCECGGRPHIHRSGSCSMRDPKVPYD